jgi:MoaA/NifB/PqqE/SkfB family radical SAM enzyme
MPTAIRADARDLARPGRAKELVGQGVGGVDVVVYGSDEPMHDWHAGSAGSFRRTVVALRRARGAGLPFVITCEVSRSNYRHLSEVVRVAHTLGARALRFVPVPATAMSPPAPGALLSPHLRRAVALARVLSLAVAAPGMEDPPGTQSWFEAT